MRINKDDKVLITGGTGFVGTHLIQLLASKGFSNLHATSLSGENTFLKQNVPQCQIYKINLTDGRQVKRLIEQVKPQQIYHLASIAMVGESFENPNEILQNNISLQVNLLEAVRDIVPDCKILAIGSADGYISSEDPINEEVKIQPVSPYGISKAVQDMLSFSYFKSYGLNIARVRPFNHIGERQSAHFVVAAFAKQIAEIEKGKRDKIAVGNLQSIRDFTDVKDMVEAYYLLIQSGIDGDVYNVGSGKGIKIADLLQMLVDLSTVKIEVVVDQGKLRPSDNPIIVADNSKIANIGWQPQIPIEDTLLRILQYWRDNV